MEVLAGIDPLLPSCPLVGVQPAAWAGAPMGHRTSNLLAPRRTPASGAPPARALRALLVAGGACSVLERRCGKPAPWTESADAVGLVLVMFFVGRAALQLSRSPQIHSFGKASFLRPPGPSASPCGLKGSPFVTSPSIILSPGLGLGSRTGGSGKPVWLWGFLCTEQPDS